MDVIYLLLPLALGFVLAGLCLFVIAVRGGQFDDLDTPARRMLLDELDVKENAR